MKFTNRIISIVLCVLMIFAVACISASAKTTYPVGDWVFEKINNNTEFEVDAYKGTDANVSTYYYHNTLPITSIGTHAFLNNTTVKSITLSPVVHSIQEQAFLNVAQLETVVFNGDIKLIGSMAFAGCKSLKNIALDQTQIASVAYSSFQNCDSLVEVKLPDTVTSIADSAFANCDSLQKITIPQSVTQIHEDAFSNTNNVVIYCYEGSTAHTYAQENEIEFVLIEDTGETYVLGDSDNDGTVSVMDASEIQLYLVGRLEDADVRIEIRGDVDSDKTLSVLDATYIQFYAAEKLDDADIKIGEVFPY